jgi:hypothetical protein
MVTPKYLLVCIALCIALFPVPCSSVLAQELQKMFRRDFFENYRGKVAWVPAQNETDARSRLSVWVFPKNGSYSIPRPPGDLFLLVSHSVRRDVVDLDAEEVKQFPPTYLGVQMVLEYRSPTSRVNLIRTGDWVRDPQSWPLAVGEDCENAPFHAGEWAADPSITVTEFKELHLTNSSGAADCKLGEWHAQPDPGLQSSWEKASWWASDVEGTVIGIKNYLIRFTPTLRRESKRTVLFSAKVSDVQRIKVRTFAPFPLAADLFDNELTINFKD